MDRSSESETPPGSPVADWAAGLRRNLIEPIPEEIADHQIHLATEAARLSHLAGKASEPARLHSPIRRRIVFTGLLSTWLAKMMAGVVAVAAAGGAAAAGLDMGPLSGIPFPVVVDDDSGSSLDGENGVAFDLPDPEDGIAGLGVFFLELRAVELAPAAEKEIDAPLKVLLCDRRLVGAAGDVHGEAGRSRVGDRRR